MNESTKKWVIRTILALVSLGFIGGIVVVSTIMYFSFSLPKISSLADYNPSIPSQILSRDGHILAEVGKEKREIVRIEDIPQRVIDGFLSAEDSGFYEHKGVDYLGVLRAFLANIRAGKVVQGGSTITQQVAKSLLLSRERSISRKIKDFLLAQKIEERFSKRDILFLYLNQVYLGGGYYGVKAAFKGYFEKELSEASNAEIAMVAGLLVAPGRYSPYVKPIYAKKRQRYVLGRMFQTGKISKEKYEEALKEKIIYRLRKPSQFKAGYFTDWVRQRVVNFLGEEQFLTQGYKVHTTLDYGLQKIAEEKVVAGVKDVDKRQGFSGPVDFLNIDKEGGEETYRNYIIDYRKKVYRKESRYFTLTEEKEKRYEFELDEEKLSLMLKEYNEENELFKRSNLIKGNNKDDQLLAYIRKSETYKAVVVKVSRRARIIYVSIGGVIGIIPYKYFRWAHERIIKDTRQYFSLITNPSKIVKVGDVVYVDIKELKVKPVKYFEKNYRTAFKKSSFYKKNEEIISKQTMLLCGLDQLPEPQGALVSISPKNGEVKAFVGGVDFQKSQFNRAIQSKRQPGSSFKPLLFAAALENGYTPSTIIIDSPESLGGADESLNWKPSNYDGKFKGAMTFRSALEKSRNIPTIKIAQDVGVKKILNFTKRIGFNAKLDKDLSLALGSFGVTLIDIVKTYSLFPNGGKLVEVKSIISITDRNGETIPFDETKLNHNQQVVEVPEEAKQKEEPAEKTATQEVTATQEMATSAETVVTKVQEKEEEINPFHVNLDDVQVYDKRLAYLMTNILKGVVHHGTGRRALKASKYLGGKTGTTNNYVDAWFIGFSANLVTGVWTGLDNNKTLGWAETGSKSALPTWTAFMAAGVKKFGDRDFVAPKGIVNVLIDKKTGRPSDEASFIEAFVEGTEPSSDKELRKFNEDDEDGSSRLLEDEDYYSNQ